MDELLISFQVCLLISFYHILTSKGTRYELLMLGYMAELVYFPEFIRFELKASPQAFNCTLVAPSTREADNTICSVSAQDQS